MILTKTYGKKSSFSMRRDSSRRVTIDYLPWFKFQGFDPSIETINNSVWTVIYGGEISDLEINGATVSCVLTTNQDNLSVLLSNTSKVTNIYRVTCEVFITLIQG